jgi:hypothetical protein
MAEIFDRFGGSAWGRLASSTLIGFFASLLALFHADGVRNGGLGSIVPFAVMGAGMGFCAASGLLMHEAGRRAIAARRTEGRGVGLWPLLQVAAVLFLLVAVVALCITLAVMLEG